MKEIIETIARKIVDEPDKVVVREIVEEDDKILIELDVAEEDKSRVIGKKGKIAGAMRTILKSAGIKDGIYVRLKIVD